MSLCTEEASSKKYVEVYQSQKTERSAIQKQMQTLQQELDGLVPSAKRESFVWLYENRTAAAK